VESEKDQFKNFRDKNMDGYLNLEEVRAWVIPEDYDNSKEETKHLFRESDVDRVGFISLAMYKSCLHQNGLFFTLSFKIETKFS
jgi:Ca2+-binding EF-hand superfamily protein